MTAALVVVRLEPLCEGAHCIVIQSHLAERNLVEAVRHYHCMKSLLARELGVRPAQQLTKLLAAHGLAE